MPSQTTMLPQTSVPSKNNMYDNLDEILNKTNEKIGDASNWIGSLFDSSTTTGGKRRQKNKRTRRR